MGHKTLYHEGMTERECARILRRMRRRGGQTRCPDCGGARHWISKGKGQIIRYTCRRCRRKFSDLTGTIFERTRTPLRKWFKAIDMFLHFELNARKLSLAIEVTYKTAWSILQKLRSVMLADLQGIVLDGEVEIDDSYIGGKRKGRRGRGAAGKTPIIGMIARDGRAYAKTAPKLDMFGIADVVTGKIHDDATIITDEFSAYNILDLLEWKHQVVNHSVTYSDNGVHTNSIEGFFSLIKRTLRARYLGFKHKYLNHYLAELCFRKNHKPVNMSYDLLALCSVP